MKYQHEAARVIQNVGDEKPSDAQQAGKDQTTPTTLQEKPYQNSETAVQSIREKRISWKFWDALDPVAKATWALVVVTTLTNIGLLLFNFFLERDTREALRESHEAAQAHALVAITTPTENIPSTSFSLTSTGVIYNLRTWCLAFSDDAPSAFILPQVTTPTTDGTSILGPGQGTTIKPNICMRLGTPGHSLSAVFIYYLYRQADGTPQEGAIFSSWNAQASGWYDLNPKRTPQYADILNTARNAMGRDTFFGLHNIDNSL